MSQNDSIWMFKRLSVGFIHICPNFQKTKQKFWKCSSSKYDSHNTDDKMYFALIP